MKCWHSVVVADRKHRLCCWSEVRRRRDAADCGRQQSHFVVDPLLNGQLVVMGGGLYRKLCARQPLANYLRKCRAGGSFVWMHFYLLPSFNFCLLNLFIYFVLGYHIRW